MLVNFKKQIEQLRYMKFQALSHADSNTNWNGKGFAEVTITQIQTGTQVLTRLSESGFFSLEKGENLPFSNTYKFIWHHDKVALYHERFGEANPIWLVDLITHNNQTLISAQPHICVNDHYHLTIKLNLQGINMVWQIKGPNKETRLNYQYFQNTPPLLEHL